MTSWHDNIEKLHSLLNNLTVTDAAGAPLNHEEGYQRWQEMSVQTREADGCIFFVGNGASASMASHFATDIAKNGGIRAQVFTDSSLLTALGNDISFDQVYAEPLRWQMKKKDMLIAVSSSGNSPNIVEAVKTARELGGQVVTLSAMQETNTIRVMGDLNFYIQAATYGHAETGHAAILHYWMDGMEKIGYGR